jgi:hypothetical protein
MMTVRHAQQDTKEYGDTIRVTMEMMEDTMPICIQSGERYV